MSNHPRSWRRWAATLAACVTALGAGALATLPAQADGGPVLRVSLTSDDIYLPVPPTPSDPTYINWGAHNDGPGTAEDVKISVDLSEIIDWVTADDTVPADHVYTWERGAVDEDGDTGGILGLNAKPGTPLGTTGTVTLSGTAANGTVVGTTAKVTVGTTELRVNALPERSGVKPGSRIRNPIAISNTGTLPAAGVQLRLRTTIGLDYAQSFANCAYDTVREPDYNMTQQALCTFDTVIEPGQKYQLDQPVGLQVTGQALFEFFGHEAQVAPQGTTGGDGTGPVLSLVPAGDADSSGVASDRQTINADNTADMVAVGDTAKGHPGDVVQVTATMRNDGPGWLSIKTSDDQPALMVTIPKGTTAVAVPEQCYEWGVDGPAGEPAPTGKPKYICLADPSEFQVGDARNFQFGLKIGAKAGDTTGEIRATTAYDSPLTFDGNHANDTAALAVQVTGAKPSSSGQRSGNAPSAQTVSNTAAGTGSGTGPLASTGSSGALPLIAGAAAAATAAGAAALLAARLRRHQA